MINATIKLTAAMFAGCLLTAGALAEPLALSDTQLDSVVGGSFVCPVISTDAVLNSPKGGELGVEGYYTIGGPTVSVPMGATNGDGTGSPAGPFTQPGDTTYTAIWY